MSGNPWIYRCYFNFTVIHRRDGDNHHVESDEGIAAFRIGFWINDDIKLTKGADAKYWIPPSQIIRIEKRQEGE
jgi:hypothetical protein